MSSTRGVKVWRNCPGYVVAEDELSHASMEKTSKHGKQTMLVPCESGAALSCHRREGGGGRNLNK